MYMSENRPYETVIICIIFVYLQHAFCEVNLAFQCKTRSDSRSEGAQTYRQTLYGVELPPVTYR